MNTRTILLVEDNPSDVELTKRAFEKGRITNTLVVAEDGQDALDYLFCERKYKQRMSTEMPALILLDLKLPKVDGLEVLRRLRHAEKTHRLPIVMLTSSKEERDLATSYDLGVNSYITKPVDFSQFADAVKSLGLYWLVINEPPPIV
ncbi:MAG TPA: response regulator [Bacteroidota bacterium]|nr:response regulator [Bacteroidota bacterium]